MVNDGTTDRNQQGPFRRASHAGSWYKNDPHQLDAQLTSWLSNASAERRPARAVIVPHAGYDYSGPTAAFAFNQLDPQHIKRIFILGPGHHSSHSGKCALACVATYQTPLGNLPIDEQVYKELKDTGEFLTLSVHQDEKEHSLEMQLPYIAKIMQGCDHAFTIVPVVVGALSEQSEARYGALFARYLDDPDNVFVISSDFCHWGSRFGYTFYDRNCGAIWESIEKLDHQGMAIIERLAPVEFQAYLNEFGNTICGRHPIGVFLFAIERLKQDRNSGQPIGRFDFKFVKYAQSQHCQSERDSSVSYAAGALIDR